MVKNTPSLHTGNTQRDHNDHNIQQVPYARARVGQATKVVVVMPVTTTTTTTFDKSGRAGARAKYTNTSHNAIGNADHNDPNMRTIGTYRARTRPRGTFNESRGRCGLEASTNTQEDTMTTPRTWTLTIPAPTIKPVRRRRTGKLHTRKPWLNANDRDHWTVISPIRKQWRTNGHNQATAASLPTGLEHVTIHAHIHRPTHRKADVGNYYPTIKAIVDGLTDYGLFDDDNDDHLTGPFLHPGTVGPAAVTLTITEEAHQA